LGPSTVSAVPVDTTEADSKLLALMAELDLPVTGCERISLGTAIVVSG
jgi:hypothetical protein